LLIFIKSVHLRKIAAMNAVVVPSANINPVDQSQRRRFIKAYFESHYQWDEAAWEALRAAVENEMCASLHKKGVRNIGQAFFEYQLDSITWADYVTHLKAEELEHCWPWNKEASPKADDLREDSSSTYKTWRQARGYPIEAPQKPRAPVFSSSTTMRGGLHHGASTPPDAKLCSVSGALSIWSPRLALSSVTFKLACHHGLTFSSLFLSRTVHCTAP
jgi:hypothetical protein